MNLGLAKAKVLVTGGASHIGRAIVLTLAEEGAAIAIVDRDEEQARLTAAEALQAGAAAAYVVVANLADQPAARVACEDAIRDLGGIDVFVNNVGYNHPDFFMRIDPDDWDALIAVNLISLMTCTRAVLPTMIAAGHGAIVATASTAAFGEPRQSVYAAAKAGVIAFVRTIALEYGRDGIRANAVAPGLTLPDGEAEVGAQSLWRNRNAIMNADQIAYVEKQTPLRRLSKSQDIANAVAFLASNNVSRQITGQLIMVAGGFAMR